MNIPLKNTNPNVSPTPIFLYEMYTTLPQNKMIDNAKTFPKILDIQVLIHLAIQYYETKFRLIRQ